jgi:hypothetical protein
MSDGFKTLSSSLPVLSASHGWIGILEKLSKHDIIVRTYSREEKESHDRNGIMFYIESKLVRTI